MAAPGPGRYVITPKQSNGDALLIGPVPYIDLPPDVPVRIGDRYVDRWILSQEEDNTFSVFAEGGGPGSQVHPGGYRWIVEDNVLYVSVVRDPGKFRFEFAGDGLVVIGLPGKDALLTLDRSTFPSLTFKYADGSDAQRFALRKPALSPVC